MSVARLEKLVALRNKGDISLEEFNRLKTRFIDGEDARDVARRKATRRSQRSLVWGLGFAATALVILYFGQNNDMDRALNTTAVKDDPITRTNDRPPAIDDKAALKMPTYLCRNLDDLKRISYLVGKNDSVAAASYGESHCDLTKTGGEFVVEKTSIFSLAACIRRVADPECLWVPDGALDLRR